MTMLLISHGASSKLLTTTYGSPRRHTASRLQTLQTQQTQIPLLTRCVCRASRVSHPPGTDMLCPLPVPPQPTPAPNIDMSNVTIVDAQKTTDHVGASNFIVYVIRSGTDEAKRRYSEFEALRSALVQLHPTLIIPPIPSKHTLSDYAVKQSKAKEDATIIARRKRMLQSFLRRCASHPELQHSDVLRKFLDGRWTWVSGTVPLFCFSSR